MATNTGRILSSAAIVLWALLPAAAQPAQASAAASVTPHSSEWLRLARTTPSTPRRKKAPPTAEPERLPARTPFTAAEDAAAVIPGMPEARFWADSITDFEHALPSQPGPWLVLSSGGEDGAFGAGLLSGLTAAGKRPDFSVVTGVSTGALMAPFAFAGSHYDGALREAYTKITAADVFEIGQTPESFVKSWPLKEFIGKNITPALLTDIADRYRRGRRLFIVTTDLDSERSVVWNMGAIAARGGDSALKLFREILLASSSVPGAFPPVLIDVEANGKRFAEMHVDGGVGGQFFVAPASLLAATSDYRLPATQLYIIIDSGLQPYFQVVRRSTPAILAQSVDMAVKVDTRLMIDRVFLAAKRSGVDFNIATIPQDFSAPSRGPFDPDYMRALFQTGYELGKGAMPFRAEPPPYSGPAAPEAMDPAKPGANK